MIGRRTWGKPASVAVLAAGYAAAGLAGWLVVQAASDLGDWQAMLAADLAATLVVFACAVALDNTSAYDPYWSVAPLPIALWWAAHATPAPPIAGSGPDGARFWVLFTLLAVWGIRLTANFLRGWPGLHHEDWRYTEYRRLGTARYWLVSLAGLQLMPTLIVFAALLPVLAVTRRPGNPFGWLDVAAAAVTAGFVLLETVADTQKRRHRGAGFVSTGMWAWLRHPNYLGEVGFWWGLWLFAVAAGWGNWWTVAGPAVMTALFVAISVPLMDRRMRRHPGYEQYAAGVPALLPRKPRSPATSTISLT